MTQPQPPTNLVADGQAFLPGEDRRGAYPDTKTHGGPPPGFHQPEGVFWYPGFDTPLKNITINGKAYVVPAFDAYTAENLPAKYKQGPHLDRPTTIQTPVGVPAPATTKRYGSADGDEPYPAQSFAQEWPEAQPAALLGTYPFSVAKIREYCEGNPKAIPNPDTVPYFQMSQTTEYSAIPVLRYILDASGLPYVVKSGFRPRLLGREMQDVTFLDADTGEVIGTNVNYIASSDDGHAISAFSGHMRFSALDIQGPNGTRKELEGLLAYLRQMPIFFTEVSVGAEYRSILNGKHVPWEAQTGKIGSGTVVVGSDGRSYWRYEKSPRERDYDNPNWPGLLWGEAGDCCQGDRIHIATTLKQAREAALKIIDTPPTGMARLTSNAVPDDAGQTGVTSVANASLKAQKPGTGVAGTGNSQATPKPGLAHPPVITTDMAVGQGGAHVHFDVGTPTNGVLGVARLPRGWLEKDYANGLVAMTRVARPPGAHETRDQYQFAFHKPVAAIHQYSTGWRPLDAPEQGPTDVGVMGAQRLGQYVYAIAGKGFQGGQRRIQYVERMNSIDLRERRSHDGAIYYEGLGSAASGATTNSFAYSANSELFVSDHANPHLYYIADFGIGKTTDIDGVPMAYHWVQEDQRGFGNGGNDHLPFYPSHRFSYEFWQTYQNFENNPSVPDETQRPCFARPWSAGDYDPPEVWFFVPELNKTGIYTGRLEIYRSLYEEGNWVESRGPITLTSRYTAEDPRLVQNGGTLKKFPGDYVGNWSMTDKVNRNPKKFGYGNWYTKENKVGVVGPFRGLVFSETRDQANHSGLTFKVMRDPRKVDTLWLVAMMQGSVFNSGAWDGAWFARSSDDGKTWGRARQMTPWPGPDPTSGFTGGAYIGVPHALITDAAHIIAPASANTPNSGTVQALVNINYAGSGVGGSERQRIVFREDKVAGG